jgi:hypothetical protein
MTNIVSSGVLCLLGRCFAAAAAQLAPSLAAFAVGVPACWWLSAGTLDDTAGW